MKTLREYFNDLTPTTADNTAVTFQEVDTMRKMKITTQVGLDETEGLFNTTSDRWSRRAKHHISQTEIMNAADTSEFSQGETAVYEGQEVEVRIPIGPNGTSGIMLEGHLKMVNRSKLAKLEEGVMGMMKPLAPLNRIMQLAGLEHSSAVTEETTEAEDSDVITEADAAVGMFNQLYQANVNSPAYKNNPDAAKIATIGQILASMQSIIQQIPTQSLGPAASQLTTVPGIGANLIKTATAMTKTGSAGAAGGAE